MSHAQYAHNHVLNPETGFIENPAYPNNFDSKRKLAFLSLYKENGIRLRRTCRAMGLSDDTVNNALRYDSKFKQMFDDVEKDYLEELEATSRENALNPRSVIERIFQLKCLLPAKYGQENRPVQQNITLNIDGKILEMVRERAQIMNATVINSTDAETVDNQPAESARIEYTNGISRHNTVDNATDPMQRADNQSV